MGILTLIKTARHALAQWKALPADERERLRDDADRVRFLSVELAGPAATKLLGSDADMVDGPAAPRDRHVVTAELSSAVARLSVAAGRGAGQAVHDSSRTARLGVRLARSAARRLSR